MNDSTTRFIFAALCLLGLVAIWCGAAYEANRQKHGSTISKRHFRWRMVSAVLWTLILGSLAYGTLFSWPSSHDLIATKRFGKILAGSVFMMLIAGFVFIFDAYLTVQTRKIQTARMQQDLGEIARQEIERAQSAHRAHLERTQVEKEGGENV